jgi:hypothetical protein
MDYFMVVTAAGKSLVVSSDRRGRMQIVKRDRIVTTTATYIPHPQPKRQHLYLTLAGPPVR